MRSSAGFDVKRGVDMFQKHVLPAIIGIGLAAIAAYFLFVR